jgi:uncharacterized membrane protein
VVLKALTLPTFLIALAPLCPALSGCSLTTIQNTYQSIAKSIAINGADQCGGQLTDNGGTLQRQDLLSNKFCTPSDGYFFSLTFDL